MAITRGVTWNGFASAGAIAGCFLLARFWLRMAPHDEAAGDQITGFGPSVASSGQPSASNCAPSPDDVLCTATYEQVPLTVLSFDALNDSASDVRRSNFSGDVAIVTAVQPFFPLGTAVDESEPFFTSTLHAAPAAASITSTIPSSRRFISRSPREPPARPLRVARRHLLTVCPDRCRGRLSDQRPSNRWL